MLYLILKIVLGNTINNVSKIEVNWSSPLGVKQVYPDRDCSKKN